jgi:hypothetical protein
MDETLQKKEETLRKEEMTADNQNKENKEYRDLSEKIAAMNKLKELGILLGQVVEQMQSVSTYDQRWVSIGKTHLQEGIMALVRGIAQPATF